MSSHQYFKSNGLRKKSLLNCLVNIVVMTSEFVHLDGTRVEERILGVGGTGLVIQQGLFAVKIPRLSRDLTSDGEVVRDESAPSRYGDYDIRADRIKSINDEAAIYERLGHHDNIVCCYSGHPSQCSLQMTLMQNGDLRRYFENHAAGRDLQLKWFTMMANAVVHAHSRRIIIADLRLDNFLLDEYLNVKLGDFGESTLMPLEWDLTGPDNLGFSVLTDLGQLGAVIYEIVTGEACKFDIFQSWEISGHTSVWPSRDSLPTLENVWLGEIIEKCWTAGYQSATDMLADLAMMHV